MQVARLLVFIAQSATIDWTVGEFVVKLAPAL
jgi:hypothetical protein